MQVSHLDNLKEAKKEPKGKMESKDEINKLCQSN